ncbi:MAG: diguanylate cyclase [Proteobacteria bacterium]|nr:diguanylate cyclase [Pseudomonadota bacterium]
MDSRPLQSKAPATRIMKILGALVACIFAIAIPFWYYMLSVSEIRDTLTIESVFVAKSIEKVIQARPDMWEFENLRLQEIILKTALHEKPCERIIRNAAGTEVVKTDLTTRSPIASVSVTLFDSGRPVGSFEAKHSIRTPVVFTVLLGIFTSFLGGLIYFIFLTYPIKKIDSTLADLRRAEEEQRISRETAERLAEETSVIADIGQVIGSTLDIDDVYDRFAVEAKKLIPFDRIAVNLCNIHENTLTIAYVSGSDIPHRKQGDSPPLTGSLTEEVLHRRTGLIIQPESHENIDEIVSRIPVLSPTFQAGLRSLMSLPLISRDEAIGVLHFRSKKTKAYTERDLHLAERIGRQISGAIANAQLFSDRKRMEEEIREMSLRDQMTELYNRRGFITLAEQQIRAANRAQRAMLLTFIDLDGLKWINDTFGHEEGDRALIDAANVLRQTFRESDIIARLGGDEFAVLSIYAADMNPEDFSKRLQENIDAGNAKETRPYKLAMSWGTAVYDPGSPLSLDELMSSADERMYAQKKAKSDRRI